MTIPINFNTVGKVKNMTPVVYGCMRSEFHKVNGRAKKRKQYNKLIKQKQKKINLNIF